MWYSVKILIDCKIDNSDEKIYEESIVLVEANSETEAEEVAFLNSKSRNTTYKNLNGDMVSWTATEVLDIQDLDEESFFSGMEVWSETFKEPT